MIFSISSELESPPNCLLILKYMISNKDLDKQLNYLQLCWCQISVVDPFDPIFHACVLK